MLSRGLEQFAGKRVLLLQGPMGPFFARLALDLRNAGARVYKINFNGGDWFFYPRLAFNYRGTMEAWPAYFEALVTQEKIDIVLLYGDCRPIHSVVQEIAQRHGLDIGVFEEGYLRPNHITLERFGVNGFSKIPQDPTFYQARTHVAIPERQVGNTYWPWVWYTVLYYTAAVLGRFWFRGYRHHRPLSVTEAWPWLRGLWRKLCYSWRERGMLQRLITQYRKSYYLVPLQVFNDAQLRVHAGLSGMEPFITMVMNSFAQCAPQDTVLVFKHHPMDRGYCDYTRLIARLANEQGVAGRVYYLHDQHLPTLLDNCRGVVVVNSTVGISALLHKAATKSCGKAIYGMPGLTYQGNLDNFWADAEHSPPERGLFLRFRAYLMAQTQLNGSFYRRIPGSHSHIGVIWPAEYDGAGRHESVSTMPADR